VRYQQVVLAYYTALWQLGVDVDVIPVTADLSRYHVVVAPALHMIKGDVPQRLEAVAARGGCVVTTFLSGRVDENDNAFLMDVPGPLGPLMGIRIDEWDAREPEFVNPVRLESGSGPASASGPAPGPDRLDSAARLIFELVIPQGAEVVGTYQADFYAGTPAVTRNRFGAGQGWYVAAGLDQQGVTWVVRQVLAAHDIELRYPDVPDLETALRVAPDGSEILFLLNHRADSVEIAASRTGTDLLTGARIQRGEAITLRSRDVLVLRTQ
jgi:beta-galactosidase